MKTWYSEHIGKTLTHMALTPLALLAFGIGTAHADTDWIVLPQASESNRMLLHALRDNSKPVATDLRLDKSGKIPSLRIGNNKTKYTFGGINYQGVAALWTAGDPSRDKLPKYDKRYYKGDTAVHLILRKCSTAEQGVNLLRDGAKKSLIFGNLIFFIADAERAFVVECSHKHFASFELTSGFCVYANTWKLPGMQDASTRLFNGIGWQSQREWTAAESLRNARKNGGTISPAESFAASRIGTAEANNPAFNKARTKDKKPIKVYNTPAMKTSADGVLFEIDREFPGVLSCAYVAFGPQRHTVYLPVPVGAAEKLPAELTPDQWKKEALARGKAAAPETPVNSEIIAFENRMLAEFAKKREEARRLMRGNQTAEAKKLLQENLQRQAGELDKFLKTIGK